MSCKRKYPPHWHIHSCGAVDSRREEARSYELELIECEYGPVGDDTWLLVPGYFQNAFIYDLWPEGGISVARHISERSGAAVFVLHPNGIGRSDYIKKSNIDDIAIDDIRAAVSYLRQVRKGKLWLMGHSNGAIVLQMYLAGLGRSSEGNIFHPEDAERRQEEVDGLLLAAGNVCMTDDIPGSRLKKMAFLGYCIKWVLYLFGWINACLLTQFIAPVNGIFGRWSLAYGGIWGFLYDTKTVSKQAKKRHYDLTIDGTSAATLIQYIDGVRGGGLKTTARIPYWHGLASIRIPVAQVTFSDDLLALPDPTYRDNFNRIGSGKKGYYVISGQRHEDFMLVESSHSAINEPMDFLMNA